MALYVFPQRFQMRGFSEAECAARNEVLIARELQYETDTGRCKIGDGATPWNDLPYCGLGTGYVLESSKGQANGVAPLEADGKIDVSYLPSGGGGNSLNPSAALYLYEEFMRGVTTSTASGTNYVLNNALPVAYSGGSSGGSATSQAGLVAGHPGVLDLSTGTGSSALWRLYPWCAPNVILGAGELTIRWSFMIGQASDATNRFNVDIGLRDGITGTGTNGLMLTYSDNVNGGNWRIYTLVAGSQTNVDSSVPVVTGSWLNVELVVNASGTSAEFKVNGVSVGTITSGIPTLVQGVNIGIGKVAGTSARHLYVDFVEMGYSFTTPR